MATVIWCARFRWDVQESRTEVEQAIIAADKGFIFVKPLGAAPQVALNIDHISSFEALPGDPV